MLRPLIAIPLLCTALLGGCGGAFHHHFEEQAAPVSRFEFNQDDDDFRFAVIGDRTGGARAGVFTRAMDQINWLQPDFVVSVGDLIEGYTEDVGVLASEWGQLDDMVARLDMPFFYVVGNHDMGNNVMREYWQQRYGNRDYYHFVYKDVLFIALNTEDPPTPLPAEMQAGIDYFKQLLKTDPKKAEALLKQSMEDGSRNNYELPTTISDDQVAWVRDILDDHDDTRWVFVLMHKPAWVFDHPNWPKIEDLLAGRNYTVIAGHQHYYQHTQRGQVDYIQMGTTGGSFHRAGPGKMDHVLWVTMKSDGPHFANVRLQGLTDKRGAGSHINAF